MTQVIYKICGAAEWQEAEMSGTYEGSPDDLRDGFIHFSCADQLAVTLAKHFSGRADLVLISIKAADLGTALKWEKSRGGALFPHLYGHLNAGDAQSIQTIPLSGDDHILPTLEAL